MATSTSDSRSPRRGLGRGLSALIPESDFDMLSEVARGSIAPAPVEAPPATSDAPASVNAQSARAATSPASANNSAPHEARGNVALSEPPSEAAAEVRYLSLACIEANPFQPRQFWNEGELNDLAASLREHGVLQPVLVRPLPGVGQENDRYQLIAGERRWRAAERAGLSEIPAIVRAVDDKSALELAIIENVQRHDISAVESAQAYRRLADEFALSQEKIAARVGKSRASVANTMRLLDLPAEALDSLRKSEITEGHGRALLTASSESARRALLRRVIRDRLSVRETERLAREGETVATTHARSLNAYAPDTTRLEETLQRALGLRLKLRPRKNGGQIVINYSSPEELQRLANRLIGK